MRNLPWGQMLKWGGLWVALVVVVATTAFALGWLPQAASESIGRAAGFGLVAVCGLVIARHRRG